MLKCELRCAGAPARPAARAGELRRAQPSPPRSHRRPRILLPALGVAAGRAADARSLCVRLRAPLAMPCRRGTTLCLSMSCTVSRCHMLE